MIKYGQGGQAPQVVPMAPGDKAKRIESTLRLGIPGYRIRTARSDAWAGALVHIFWENFTDSDAYDGDWWAVCTLSNGQESDPIWGPDVVICGECVRMLELRGVL